MSVNPDSDEGGLRLCVGCRKYIPAGSVAHPFRVTEQKPAVTVWLCAECVKEYRANLVSHVRRHRCKWCGSMIPKLEWDIYFNTGFCGSCAYMMSQEEQ